MNEKTAELSSSVIKLARNTLIVKLRFMDTAICSLNTVPREDIHTICTDGHDIYYNPLYILREYKLNPGSAARNILHIIFHCVFRHFFVGRKINRELWNIACDIAAENAVLELGLACAGMPADSALSDEIALIKQNVKYLSAEHIYRYLSDNECDIGRLSALFSRDDHSMWYPRGQGDTAGDDTAEGGEGEKNGSDTNSAENDSDGSDGDNENGDGENKYGRPRTSKALEDKWKHIAEKMQMDLESFSKKYGDDGGTIVRTLRDINREKYDYAAFLKKFAVFGEAMKINDDEFDTIFYTYGLTLYENMPLIEPLEYKEVKRIKEFVIAIDTSGSVSGLVKRFIRKTYNILKQEESFFSKINLHIIQCDARIQEKVKITTQTEFDDYISKMKVRGFMGTDFRPVFGYVDELIEKKEFHNLKGLIYFTDGYGIFPEHQPAYSTAVVYVDDDRADNNFDVPVWAIKLILRPEEI